MTAIETQRLERLVERVERLEEARRRHQREALQKVVVALATIEVTRDGGGRFAQPGANVTAGDMQRAYGTRRVVRGLLRDVSAAERDRLLGKMEGRYQ